MRESWVGLQSGVDARKWAGVLRRAHELALRGGHVPTIVRGVIADSWERCTETGVDPGDTGPAHPPMVVDSEEAAARWREHPLAETTDVLHGVLGNLLQEARHIAVVSDAEGCLLWSDGHPHVLSASEEIRFTPGHSWSERAAGTNAVGTALAADHAVQVFSAEHYRSEIHGWQCSGAPIHDPETGDALGAIDVTGRFDTASPHTLALVQMAARLVEERLRARMLERDARILCLFAERAHRYATPRTQAAALSPSGRILATTGAHGPLVIGERVEVPGDVGEVTLRDGTGAAVHPLGEGALLIAGSPEERRAAPRLRLVLGAHPRARFLTPTAEHRLTVRHSQIAAVLARHPDGVDARTLSRVLYGGPGHEVAVRSELHRLREILGPALATRPYRLQGVAVEGRLAQTDSGGA